MLRLYLDRLYYDLLFLLMSNNFDMREFFVVLYAALFFYVILWIIVLKGLIIFTYEDNAYVYKGWWLGFSLIVISVGFCYIYSKKAWKNRVK